MSIYDELRSLEHLSSIGSALVRYAISLEPGLEFQQHDGRWVPSNSKNFVTFEFHWKRTLNIRISLRGYPEEHCHRSELEIKAGMSGYSECVINSEKQLMPASIAIWRAHQLFVRGRDRERNKLSLVEGVDTSTEGWLPPRPKDPGFWCGTPFLMEVTEWYSKVEEYAKNNGLKMPNENG